MELAKGFIKLKSRFERKSKTCPAYETPPPVVTLRRQSQRVSSVHPALERPSSICSYEQACPKVPEKLRRASSVRRTNWRRSPPNNRLTSKYIVTSCTIPLMQFSDLDYTKIGFRSRDRNNLSWHVTHLRLTKVDLGKRVWISVINVSIIVYVCLVILLLHYLPYEHIAYTRTLFLYFILPCSFNS